MIKPAIRIVENDPLFRLFALDMIEEAGFKVLQASDATVATATMEDRLDIRVFLTDLDMPGGISGITLAARPRVPSKSCFTTRPSNLALHPGLRCQAPPRRSVTGDAT